MPNETQPNEVASIIRGVALLFGCHAIVLFILFVAGLVIDATIGGYAGLWVWVVGAMGFLFWQLLYVVPLIFWLKRRGKATLVKGVIVGAVLTALLNGACWLSFR